MQVITARYIISSPSADQCPAAIHPEYAFIGRSNVGKSSLINLITGNSKLAKVSSSPGKTQLINHFLINENDKASVPWYLVDLPGYGYAKRSKSQRQQWQKMIEDYLTNRENIQTVFVLIDSRLPPQKIDLDFLGKLGMLHVPFNIVFTKSDKNTQSETAKNVRTFIDKMKEDWEYIPLTFISSTVKGRGKKEILSYIGELNQQFMINQ